MITDKPLTASEEEVAKNPRSRSAKLRVAERIEVAA
jgi:16S rRNA (cytosine1402-N4)-methyltransferase